MQRGYLQHAMEEVNFRLMITNVDGCYLVQIRMWRCGEILSVVPDMHRQKETQQGNNKEGNDGCSQQDTTCV